ncbi:hypothetical protein COOONC_22872, partial [Cooperia oncophora]
MKRWQMVEGWQLYVFNAMVAYFSAAYLINLCGKKDKQQGSGSGSRGSKKGPKQPSAPPPPTPKAPAVGGIAGTYDPNYQTLANVQGDVFGADKKAGAAQPPGGAPRPPVAPAAGGVA